MSAPILRSPEVSAVQASFDVDHPSGGESTHPFTLAAAASGRSLLTSPRPTPTEASTMAVPSALALMHSSKSSSMPLAPNAADSSADASESSLRKLLLENSLATQKQLATLLEVSQAFQKRSLEMYEAQIASLNQEKSNNSRLREDHKVQRHAIQELLTKLTTTPIVSAKVEPTRAEMAQKAAIPSTRAPEVTASSSSKHTEKSAAAPAAAATANGKKHKAAAAAEEEDEEPARAETQTERRARLKEEDEKLRRDDPVAWQKKHDQLKARAAKSAETKRRKLAEEAAAAEKEKEQRRAEEKKKRAREAAKLAESADGDDSDAPSRPPPAKKQRVAAPPVEEDEEEEDDGYSSPAVTPVSRKTTKKAAPASPKAAPPKKSSAAASAASKAPKDSDSKFKHFGGSTKYTLSDDENDADDLLPSSEGEESS